MLIKIENNQPVGNPILEDNFRSLHPDQAFPLVLTPEIVEPFGYGMYDFTQIPTIGPYQKLVEGTPVKNQYGIWRQVWNVVNLTGQELADRVLEIKARKWEEIKHLRDTKTQTGGYKVGTNWFHSDTFSRTQQIGLVMMGASMPSNLSWKTMNGTFVSMTPTLAQQIFSAAGTQDMALFSYAENMKVQMEASNDPANFDITQGWPETYSGA